MICQAVSHLSNPSEKWEEKSSNMGGFSLAMLVCVPGKNLFPLGTISTCESSELQEQEVQRTQQIIVSDGKYGVCFLTLIETKFPDP